MKDVIERTILTLTPAIETGVKLSELHQMLLDKGWSEEEIFLFVRAGLLLLKYRNTD